ncbi:MAG: LAGLIDADG family homing endonuclease [Candidatus Yanofskybacteria bacterium]|nr:LAGLIDADG family homing endonuclease [Candidatus Yanofskybacteria bacterium]
MPISTNRALRAYIIGLAIGDGNLSNPNGRATRLRITCDLAYPELIRIISESLASLFPGNKVSLIRSKGKYLNVSVYSNHLEALLGWRAKGGSKYRQNVAVPTWVANRKNYITACLRGLLETDGAVYHDRGYQMVTFSTIIPGLASQVHAMFCRLGFQPRLYTTQNRPPRAPFTYQVRLAKDVGRFLQIVRPVKE